MEVGANHHHFHQNAVVKLLLVGLNRGYPILPSHTGHYFTNHFNDPSQPKSIMKCQPWVLNVAMMIKPVYLPKIGATPDSLHLRCVIFSGTGGKSRPGDGRCRVNDEWRMGCGVTITPPKFNSTFAPWKLTEGPNRKPDRLPLPAFFRGKLAVKLRGCILMLKWEWARVTWRIIPPGRNVSS